MQPIVDVNRLELVQERIKEYILINRLRPKEKLPTEEQLAESLQVSRTVIREALRSLEALGIVEARQGYGRVVRDFNFDAILNNLNYGIAFHNYNIYKAHEIRKALEIHFIETAIANITAEDIAELGSLIQRMQTEDLSNLHQFRHDDFRFHRLLFIRCGNELALQLLDITWKVADAALQENGLQLAVEATLPTLAHEHAAIFEAIKAGDVDEARRNLILHYRNIEQRLLSRREE